MLRSAAGEEISGGMMAITTAFLLLLQFSGLLGSDLLYPVHVA